MDYIKNKPSVPQLPTNSSGYLSNDGVGNLTWANPTSSSAIDWTNIGYTIGQIVFDPSNKKLYYANQTFPYGTGYPPSYPGNPYFTPFTSSVTSLINNGYTVNLGTDGYLNLPNGSDGLGALIQSPSPIRINSNNNFWTFGADGNLELPGNIVADNLSIQGAPLTIIISGADWSPANVIYTRLEGATPPKWVPANYNPGLDSYITFDNDGWGLKNPVFPYPIYVGTGGLYNPSTTWASDTAHNLGNSNPTASYTYNNWTFGSDGSTSVPGSLNYNVPGLGASGEFDINSWYPVKISTGDSVNVPIKTWTFGWDGYLTGESLHLQGYLKGVDGSIGSTGQVLTRQSNGGAAWAAATGGGSSSLVNGSATLTLNSDGSVSVPLASVIKAATDSYTGIATHNMNTFAYVNADGFFVDTLYNTAEYEWHFNNTGGLTLPSSIFPITFSAVLLPVYGGAPDIGPYGGDAWTLSVTFTEDANGVVSTSVAQIFPISNNPGYKTGDTYHFTQTAHGIPGYTLTIVLDNVQYPGGAGWTANVECSQAPASPSTVSSNHAIKINSNNNIWAFGSSGGLTLPDGSIINDGEWSSTNGLVLENHDTDFSLQSSITVGASGQASIHSQNDSGSIQLTVTTDSHNNNITIVNNSHTWIFSNDGYLTGESLHLTGYLKGVDGSIGTTGQVLTRASNGGAEWADSTGGSSNPNGGVADNTAGITITTYTLQNDQGQYDNSGSVTYNIRDAGATAAGVIINGLTVSHTQTITGGINQGDNVLSWSTIDYQLWEQVASITAYVTDSRGYTFYTVVQDAYEVPHGPCLVEGTMITMANGTHKAIEDITPGELIRVWNFDLGEFSEAQPIWIKVEEETTGHDVYTFSDGTQLRTVGHHVFNKQAGAFTKLKLAETPVGTTTFNEQGLEVTLISKERVIEPTRYYNVWTQYHMNLFADGILTSNRFNNIYPIVDMKFVKDDRALRSVEEFAGIDEKYITGLRLQEQTYSVEYIQNYVHNRLERTDISNISEQGI